MREDAFARYHPAVNFLFFACAIGFGVVIQHPAYLAAGCAGAAVYYLLLQGGRGWKTILGLLPLAAVIAAVNPLFNTYGETVLFTCFGRPYTWEALCYGMVIAGMFAGMMLWFGCYNAVLTSDKFTSLFGNLIPSLSLLLVMILRMIPHFLRKTKQITGSRRSIGKGGGGSVREKLRHGMTVLSALTDWALEGSVITADSMRARGYGTARRTSYQLYRMKPRDWLLLALLLLLACTVILAGGTAAAFTPVLSVAAPGWGFAAYCLFLLLPIALHIKEAVTWRILKSGI